MFVAIFKTVNANLRAVVFHRNYSRVNYLTINLGGIPSNIGLDELHKNLQKRL